MTTTAEAPLMTVDQFDGLAPAPPEQAADTLPLVELCTILDEYAQTRPRPLPLDYVIGRPAPLPERFQAPLDVVKPGRWQPRTVFDEAELQDLASSIAEHGVLNPLIVFANEHGVLELIAGERRLRASRLAGLRFAPVEVRSYTLRQIAEIAAIDNLQRADLTAVEEGNIFNRLIQELGISEVQLAKRLGRSRGNIQQKRAIASADPAIHQAVQAGEISFTFARTIIGAAPGDAKLQQQILKEVRNRIQGGARVVEADVKKLADDTTFRNSKKILERLGWRFFTPYGETAVYAAGERPRRWSGADIVEAVREQRAPGGTPPDEVALDEAQRAALKARGWRFDQLPETRWYSVQQGYGTSYEYLSPAELVDRAQASAAELTAMVERYAAHGWTIKPSEHWCEARHPDGAYRSMHSWSDVERYLAEIEAGNVASTKVQPPAYQPPPVTCAECGQQVTKWSWIVSRKLCDATCAPAARAEHVARAEVLARRIEAALAPLASVPPATLYLLAQAHGAEVEPTSAPAAMLRALTRGLQEQLRYNASDGWEQHLPPDPGPAADGPRVGSLKWVTQQLAMIEEQIAAGTTHEITGAELEALGEELEDLADVLDDAAYEDLARRIDAAMEALPGDD